MKEVKISKEWLNKNRGLADGRYMDSSLKGFGVRVQNGRMTYILRYNDKYGKDRQVSLAQVGVGTPEVARSAAEKKLAELKFEDKDPLAKKKENREALTVADLWQFYLDDGLMYLRGEKASKKPNTKKSITGSMKNHILPLLGKVHLAELTPLKIDKAVSDITNGKTAKYEKMDKKYAVSNVRGGAGIAGRAVADLRAMLTFGIRQGYLTNNPAANVQKPKTNYKPSFITLEQVSILGKALRQEEANGSNINHIDVIKLLMLTGCRLEEILTLKWRYIDFENHCFRFPDTKTGEQVRPCGQGALTILKRIRARYHLAGSDDWVFRAHRGGGHLVSIVKTFKRVINSAPELPQKLTRHNLRHSFATIAHDSFDFQELTIAGLLGHRLSGITMRYTHNVDKSLVAAADKVSIAILDALEGRQGGKIVEFNELAARG